ncbi:alcohol dehydrogenase catalytic domain-containing protein [Sinobaca sp. H24]|uniref:alcohol dehydrogenase catalytic domain-containing protein n=1 Tax=Sinobaca sp. H24 TaxID=2923376 RepID=UPI0020799326|nr:alcohol dehydrogenase catalytic domain-containing protein [Sinobaca sp. H24]
MTMNAVYLTDKETLLFKQVPIPEPGPHDILLKVGAVGICGSDLRIYKNGDKRVAFPRITGHEIAGEIIETGSEAALWHKGDTVTLGAHIPCGTCLYCLQDLGHHCRLGESIGYQIDGGFAEYMLLPRAFVERGSIQRTAPGISFLEASLSEPFACVLSGLKKVKAAAGQTVVVYGAGAIGCMFIAALKKMGAEKVIAVQRSAPRRQFALEFGADLCLDPAAEDVEQRIKAETGGYGCDTVIVTAPSPAVQQEALTIVKTLGNVLFFAGLPKGTSGELNTNLILYKELNVCGTHGASRACHFEAVQWINERRLPFSKFVTHTFPLSETKAGFQAALGKDGLKCVITPHEAG